MFIFLVILSRAYRRLRAEVHTRPDTGRTWKGSHSNAHSNAHSNRIASMATKAGAFPHVIATVRTCLPAHPCLRTIFLFCVSIWFGRDRSAPPHVFPPDLTPDLPRPAPRQARPQNRRTVPGVWSPVASSFRLSARSFLCLKVASADTFDSSTDGVLRGKHRKRMELARAVVFLALCVAACLSDHGEEAPNVFNLTLNRRCLKFPHLAGLTHKSLSSFPPYSADCKRLDTRVDIRNDRRPFQRTLAVAQTDGRTAVSGGLSRGSDRRPCRAALAVAQTDGRVGRP
ncbi:hypothetical protein Bbelb_358090 [Branchiostoma belcheri]|nr:hypothetical protein Bbelb_358090 [Branchiostoma belcheri]